MKYEIIKKDKRWTVQFSINNQYFTLDYRAKKKEDAEWMVKMLRKALRAYKTKGK